LWVYVFFIVIAAIFSCSADKNREKVHVAKRQELKNRQRDAMLAGKPVQTVIEEVEPLMQRSTSRISCVRDMPDLKSLDKLRPKPTESSEKIEPPNFNTMQMETNQSIYAALTSFFPNDNVAQIPGMDINTETSETLFIHSEQDCSI
ncbi:hypothetical protein COOONC_08276, partial [Cooperia oncophora]